MTRLEKPQIILHKTKHVAFTPYEARWIPRTARLVVIGQHARGTGALHLLQLGTQGEMSTLFETEKSAAIKCSTFGASAYGAAQLATGDFDGQVAVYDLEHGAKPVYCVSGAHDGVVNAIDGCGARPDTGAPELATAGRDGVIKVWDVRQQGVPVAVMAPDGDDHRDGRRPGLARPEAWAVAFGDAHNNEERVVAAGYDNGDIKLFDLRMMAVRWETNVGNGVCSLQFDRQDIRMNKLVATGLEASLNVFDLRTIHPTTGCARLDERDQHHHTTIWSCKHLPQNREIFMTAGGDGALNLYRYEYPAQRTRRDADGAHDEGVAGTLQLLNTNVFAEQPIAHIDWSPDKEGLCAFTAFDQTIRVAVVTRLREAL
ncbi:hypothetical protein CXG81DRAFT_26856 [Caulochytrium protostelioides]|uniref:WD repeat-containing protein 92-like protein n=1 Tax=Caulochytrium protostelioides TaxID=1555241 RepID=A0A4P9X0D8_9FUNG|nr:WD repeat-containing protein 92-like protein [Caulochytrium protostelioides]RKP00423.1 hypothetical protein CXG81DRAFT_26856 [Caulochytrium protostelioides]|eukprot:RKP00423.1 hypothetical protein CXG81DRAFT_26856 [Caulochytrium protostelioides]